MNNNNLISRNNDNRQLYKEYVFYWTFEFWEHTNHHLKPSQWKKCFSNIYDSSVTE